MSDQTQQIFPMLAYEDGLAAMDWLCRVFGFTEKTRMLDDNGILVHGEITMGNEIIMIASPTPDYQSPKHHRQVCPATAKAYQVPYVINGILVFVNEIEEHFQTAKQNGATILSTLETGGLGLTYRAEDVEGQRWMFIQRS